VCGLIAQVRPTGSIYVQPRYAAGKRTVDPKSIIHQDMADQRCRNLEAVGLREPSCLCRAPREATRHRLSLAAAHLTPILFFWDTSGQGLMTETKQRSAGALAGRISFVSTSNLPSRDPASSASPPPQGPEASPDMAVVCCSSLATQLTAARQGYQNMRRFGMVYACRLTSCKTTSTTWLGWKGSAEVINITFYGPAAHSSRSPTRLFCPSLLRVPRKRFSAEHP